MKQAFSVLLFSFLLFLFSLLGCNPLNREKQRQQYLIAKDRGEFSRTPCDSIFLGFQFGMSEKEYHDRIAQLVNSKVLIPGQSEKTEYILNQKPFEGVKLGLTSKFHLNQLYELNVDLVDIDHKVNDLEDKSINMLSRNRFFYYEDNKGKNETHNWVKENQATELLNYDDNSFLITYRDLRFNDKVVKTKLDSIQSLNAAIDTVNRLIKELDSMGEKLLQKSNEVHNK